MDMANEEAVNCIIGSDPAWIDILPAGDVVEGLSDYTIVHSGPQYLMKIWLCFISAVW